MRQRLGAQEEPRRRGVLVGHKTLSVSVTSGRAPPKWIKKEHGQDAVLELTGRLFQDCSSVETGIGNLSMEVWGDGWGVHGGRTGGPEETYTFLNGLVLNC